jgi:glucose/arabinose dehydrogenase
MNLAQDSPMTSFSTRGKVPLLGLALFAMALPFGSLQAQTQPGFRTEVVTSEIALPWGMAWLPDGDMLVTNRRGELYRVSDGQLSEPLEGVPDVHVNGQGGLLDIALHPDYASNGWIYITYSSPEGGGGSHTALMRAT